MAPRMADFMAHAQRAMAQLNPGAFLTVEAPSGARNTMTIGWAQLGIVWGKKIFTVAVRNTRHTYGLMEAAEDFTVTFPWADMSAALGFCGSRSGADVDKFKECGLECVPAIEVGSPIIKAHGLHYECRIVYKKALDPAFLSPQLDAIYPKKDYHTLYYGDIVACYETD